MSGIFVNYRTVDERFGAGAIYALLADLFGSAGVFRDCVSIEPPGRYPDVIRAALESADILVAVIGTDWLAPDDTGVRAIDRERDWVRWEIARALERGIPLVPVLVDETPMPSIKDLPPDIVDLTRRQAFRVRHSNLGYDVRRLADHLVAAAPSLRLPRVFEPDELAAAAQAADLPPGALLRPEYAAVEFDGRQAEVAELLAWARGTAGVAVSLVTGRGGSGKTRLARRLTQLLREEGWVAGLLRDGCASQVAPFCRVETPLLVVMDYAEARSAEVGTALAAMIESSANAAARLLLLARGAGDWWREAREDPDERVAAALEAATIRALGPLVATHDDAEREYRRAFEGFARLRGYAGVTPGRRPSSHDVLDIHAQALADVLEAAASPDEATRAESPLRRVLAHERRFWDRTARASGLPDPHRARLHAVAAAATLLPAQTAAESVRVLGALRTFAQQPPDVVDRYGGWWRSVQPGTAALSPLLPDRLGEEHVGDAAAVAAGLVDVADDHQLARAIRVLARAAASRTEVAGSLSELLAARPQRALPLAIEVATQVVPADPLLAAMTSVLPALTDEALTTVLSAVPVRTNVLTRFAVELLTHAIARHSAAAESDPAVLAYLHGQLGIRLGDLGDNELALRHSETSQRLYHELVQRRGEPYSLHLAIALANTSVLLRHRGRIDEARQCASEAAAACSGSAADPQTKRRYQAVILSVLASHEAAAGADPLPASTQAVELLAADDGATAGMRVNIATVRYNHAVWLRRAGRAGEADPLAEESLLAMAGLAGSQPDAFLRPLTAMVGYLARPLRSLDALLATAGISTGSADAPDLLRLVQSLSRAGQDEFIDAVIRVCAPVWSDPAAAPSGELALRTGTWRLELADPGNRRGLLAAIVAAHLAEGMSPPPDVRWLATVLPLIAQLDRADVTVDGRVLVRVRLRQDLPADLDELAVRSVLPPEAAAVLHPRDVIEVVDALRRRSPDRQELTVEVPILGRAP